MTPTVCSLRILSNFKFNKLVTFSTFSLFLFKFLFDSCSIVVFSIVSFI